MSGLCGHRSVLLVDLYLKENEIGTLFCARVKADQTV